MAETGPDLIRTLANVVRVLQTSAIRYAVIGGIAKAAWGRARATRDVDIAISADVRALEALTVRLTAAGFSVVNSVGGDSDDARPDIFVARESHGVPVDILVAKTPFEEEAISRSVSLELLGTTLQVVTAEDLVFYKLLAGRPRDHDDMLDIVRTQLATATSFDWCRLERLAQDWDIEAALTGLRRAVDAM